MMTINYAKPLKWLKYTLYAIFFVLLWILATYFLGKFLSRYSSFDHKNGYFFIGGVAAETILFFWRDVVSVVSKICFICYC